MTEPRDDLTPAEQRAFAALQVEWECAAERLQQADTALQVDEVWQTAYEIGYQRDLARRLQAVAPLLKETQDRYKNDPERLQREMLRIYREHKVNPFGGAIAFILMSVTLGLTVAANLILSRRSAR